MKLDECFKHGEILRPPGRDEYCPKCADELLEENEEEQKRKIFEIVKQEPIVHAIFNMHRRGQISWSNALVLMVEKLAEQNKTRLDMIVKHTEDCSVKWR